jgi:hypothetical protein
MDYNVLGPVANNNNKASLLFLDSIANERGDARVPSDMLDGITFLSIRRLEHTLLCEPYRRRYESSNCRWKAIWTCVEATTSTEFERLRDQLDEPCVVTIKPTELFCRDQVGLCYFCRSLYYPRFWFQIPFTRDEIRKWPCTRSWRPLKVSLSRLSACFVTRTCREINFLVCFHTCILSSWWQMVPTWEPLGYGMCHICLFVYPLANPALTWYAAFV